MKRIIALLIAALASASAQAAPFADPTRPPNVTAETGSGGQAAAAGPRLESVLIAPDRRIAVISGQRVPLGGKYGEARVVRISESEVVLQNGDQRETLKLFPDVEKKSIRTRARRADRTDR